MCIHILRAHLLFNCNQLFVYCHNGIFGILVGGRIVLLNQSAQVARNSGIKRVKCGLNRGSGDLYSESLSAWIITSVNLNIHSNLGILKEERCKWPSCIRTKQQSVLLRGLYNTAEYSLVICNNTLIDALILFIFCIVL